MSDRTRSALVVMLALLLALTVLGVAGCSGDAEDDETTSETESTEETTAEEETDDGDAASELAAEQEEKAIDIARAYFVAQTDFTSDQFEWVLEAAAQDDEGQWWARVSADPGDTSMEIEQVYVYSPADSGFWFAHDMGTGIDPATDESFPEEVRDQL